MTQNIKSFFLTALKKAQEKIRAEDRHGWEESDFNAIRGLQADIRGAVGEDFLADMLRALGKKVEHSADTDAENKHWDMTADGITLEVKFASMGSKTPSFQHESIESKRNYDGLVIVDVAPDGIYITCLAKRDIPWDKLHNRRYGEDVYKWTLNRNKISDRKMETLADFATAYEKMEKRIKETKS